MFKTLYKPPCIIMHYIYTLQNFIYVTFKDKNTNLSLNELTPALIQSKTFCEDLSLQNPHKLSEVLQTLDQ